MAGACACLDKQHTGAWVGAARTHLCHRGALQQRHALLLGQPLQGGPGVRRAGPQDGAAGHQAAAGEGGAEGARQGAAGAGGEGGGRTTQGRVGCSMGIWRAAPQAAWAHGRAGPQRRASCGNARDAWLLPIRRPPARLPPLSPQPVLQCQRNLHAACAAPDHGNGGRRLGRAQLLQQRLKPRHKAAASGWEVCVGGGVQRCPRAIRERRMPCCQGKRGLRAASRAVGLRGRTGQWA